jgi:uncharacterized protein YcbK (DUF882 family)
MLEHPADMGYALPNADPNAPELMHRRRFLKLLCLPAAAAVLPAAAGPALAGTNGLSGRLNLFNINTRETLVVDYLRPDGKLDPSPLVRLEHLFRCKLTDRTRPIDPRLFMLLDALAAPFGGPEAQLTLICGYRSPEYNRRKARRNAKVSRNSDHVKGMAADVRLDGVALADLRRTAVTLRAGGVGAYSDFIHLDVGPVRSW